MSSFSAWVLAEVLEPLKSGCKLKLGASTRSYEAVPEVGLSGARKSELDDGGYENPGVFRSDLEDRFPTLQCKPHQKSILQSLIEKNTVL